MVWIAVVLCGLAFGLPAVNRSLPSERSVATDSPYDIGGGVTVFPPAGAQIDVTETRPADDNGTVLFRIGPVRYYISVQPYDGDLDQAVGRMRARIMDATGFQVTSSELPVATRYGMAGRQGGYSGPGRGGRFTVFVTDGRTIEVTVSGSDLDLGRTLPAIDASTRTIRYVPGPPG